MKGLGKNLVAIVLLTSYLLAEPILVYALFGPSTSNDPLGLNLSQPKSVDELRPSYDPEDHFSPPYGSGNALFDGGNISGRARSGINSFLEDSLNINVEEGLKPITEGINTLDRKGKTPEVSIRFSTPNPKPGDVITASADTFGISNVNDAYYTWLLKRSEDKCDPDINCSDIHYQKILAIREQAALYFDPLTFDQPFNGGNGNGVIDPWEWPEDQDDDGFSAPMGGANMRDGATNYCYIYDPVTGEQYELSDPGQAKTGCPDGYVARCMIEDRTLQCPVIVPEIDGEIISETETTDTTSTTTSEGSITGNGGTRFTILARCIEDGSTAQCDDDTGKLYCPTPDGGKDFVYDYGPFDAEETEIEEDPKILTPTPFCLKVDEETGQVWKDPYLSGCTEASDGICEVTIDGTDEVGNYIGDTNGGRPTIRFTKTGAEYCGGPGEECTVKISGCKTRSGDKTTYTFTNPGNPTNGCPANPGGDGRYQEGEFLWKSMSESDCKLAILLPANMSGALGDGCFAYPTDVIKPEGNCSIGESDGNECKKEMHMFVDLDGEIGTLTAQEERVFHLNPLTDRTTPLAENDGKLIAGVGQRDFTWEYQEGDEVSVIVEGSGYAATKHEDATYQTVFALPKPGCKDALFSTGNYAKTVKEKTVIINTAVTDLNTCIKKNNLFTKPGTAEFDALNVTVSASSGQDKTTQAATPSGLGIEKKITTTVAQVQGGNISNPHDLYYEWDVLCGGESLVGDENFTFTSKTKGTNLKNLTFIADFPERCFTGSTGTVEVSAKINEPRTGGGSNFGQSKTTFEIFNIADNPLKAHKTQVTSGSQYQNTNEEICTEGLDKTICRVMNNEVIAITATEMEGSAVGSEGNISWTVNGQTYTCDEKISNDCNSTHNTNIIYIPIKGRDGDLITVTALSHGVNKDQNRQQQVTRVFRITEPSVAIVPQGNTVSRKVLGVYQGFNNQEFLDESANIFEITEGTTATLSADLYPKFLNDAQDTISYEWYINGTLYDTTKTIQYAPESDTVVSVRVRREDSLDDRLALEEKFNITQSQTIPTNFTHTIELTTKQDTTLTQGVQGFFATVTTNAPEYIIFLLKITFALAVMLFIPSLVLGVGKQEN
jgi:hypothetical protein